MGVVKISLIRLRQLVEEAAKAGMAAVYISDAWNILRFGRQIRLYHSRIVQIDIDQLLEGLPCKIVHLL